MPRKATLPVRVRGVTYANAYEAAKALKVSVTTVYSALATSTTDTLGLGRGNHSNHQPPRRHPVKVGPWVFASKRAAAKWLGISTSWFADLDRNQEAQQHVTAAALRRLESGERPR